MKLRIFVIDDEESIRDTMEWHLEEQGHEVITAESPVVCDTCYANIRQDPKPCADLLFVDYQMANMTGLDFIERMSSRGCRMDPLTKYIMSGNISAIDMAKVESIGCNVLQKPVTFDEIDRIVENRLLHVNQDRKLNDLCELIQERAKLNPKNTS